MSIELEKYSGGKSRFTCPKCSYKGKFTRYINDETREYISFDVGRCDREQSCGYHYSPKEYYKSKIDTPDTRDTPLTHFDTVLFDLVYKTLDPDMTLRSNNFAKYLSKIFSDSLAIELIEKFKIGTAKNNGTIFWQFDCEGNVRTGKRILYDASTGKRKDIITFVHKSLNLNYKLEQCFFGLHQLQNNYEKVAIFESEKSAILMSVYLDGFTCMATGGANGLSLDKFRILKEKKCRSIILYPDKSFFETWSEKAIIYSKALNIDISISKVLEKSDFTNTGEDLADHLKFDPSFNWALSLDGYPVFWDYPKQIL